MNWLDPRVDRYINGTVGEIKVMEIRKPWIASFGTLIRLVLGMVLIGWAFTLTGFAYWVVFLAAYVLVAHAAYWLVAEYRDRFVVTTLQAFRVHGVFNKSVAYTPLGRIINTTSKVTPLGRLLNYGHFVFDSAAQNDAFTSVKYVKNIDQRKKVIQSLWKGILPQQIPANDEGDGT